MSGKFQRRALRLLAVGQEIAGKALTRSGLKKARTAPPPPAPTSRAAEAISDRVIVITGGSRGIGRAVAEAFAGEGSRVAVLARNGKEAESVAAEIGQNAIGLAADVTDPAALRRAFDRIEADLGPVDLLINAAGTAGPLDGAAWDMDAKAFDDVFEVNATGAFNAASEAIRRMIAAGHAGRIINVSSGAVDKATAGMGAYPASKHALEGLTGQLAADAWPHGITVCSLRLGSVRTEMTEKAFGKVKASLLPDPSSVVPAFRELATAPDAVVSGRSFAGWRLLSDPAAELYAPSPLTMSLPLSYPSYTHNGREVRRNDRDFRIFDRAENQFGPSPKVAEAITHALTDWPMQVYPDESHAQLRQALADKMGLDPAQFSIGNGSWELLDRLLEIFTSSGDEVVCGKPGWFGFNMLCHKRGLMPVKVPMATRDGRLEHDLDAVADAITGATRLVYIISPSNPEGITVPRDALRRLVDRMPEGVPLLLDEAYYEFNSDPDAGSAMDLLDREERPIFGLRTFSKFYALASMRVGYAYARPEFADLLNRGERIFNISHVSEMAAVAALQDTEHQQMVYDATISERRRIEARLDELGLDHIPSEAPYILAELPDKLETVIETFAQEGIYLGEKAFYKGKYLLFPISVPEDNDRNLALMARCLGK